VAEGVRSFRHRILPFDCVIPRPRSEAETKSAPKAVPLETSIFTFPIDPLPHDEKASLPLPARG